MSNTFKLDLIHLHKVQRSIRKSGNIFPNEKALLEELEVQVLKAQDDASLNLYYNMAQYLKQRLKEVSDKLEVQQSGIIEAIEDLTWAINYLQWCVAEKKEGL